MYMVGVAALIDSFEPVKEVQRLIDLEEEQWVSWHDIDGKIIYSDQR